MADGESNHEARDRVLEAAEQLFSRRGYNAVTLRDIAAEVGIRHTSLYHHFPGGKEELFIEVTERTLRHHRAGLSEAIAHAELDVRAQLHAASDWLLSQPPMDLVRLVYSDMPSIDPVQAQRLSKMALESMIIPIALLLEDAQSRGQIQHSNLGLIAGGLLGMIESMYSVPEQGIVQSRQAMARDLIDTMLNGLRPR